MSSKLNQHEIRRCAVATLYNLEARPDSSISEALHFALTFDNDGSEIPSFLTTLVEGVTSSKAELDQKISTYLTPDWPLARLTLIDRSILRLGAYEILLSETPDVVAVDEAINLARDYSDDRAAALINGVLTRLIKK